MQRELPQTLHARDPTPFLTQAELTRLMRWKLMKGKWCGSSAWSTVVANQPLKSDSVTVQAAPAHEVH